MLPAGRFPHLGQVHMLKGFSDKTLKTVTSSRERGQSTFCNTTHARVLLINPVGSLNKELSWSPDSASLSTSPTGVSSTHGEVGALTFPPSLPPSFWLPLCFSLKVEADLIRADPMQHHDPILFFYLSHITILFHMQLFRPVFLLFSWGVFPHLFLWHPLIINETEVPKETLRWWWYRAKGGQGSLRSSSLKRTWRVKVLQPWCVSLEVAH